MLIQAANQGTVEWPTHVVDAFGTLSALAHDQIIDRHDDRQAVLVATASTENVLVFLGAFIVWHQANDQDFAEAHRDADQWYRERTECAVQFDRHWCATAVDMGGGFYGDLVRTVDFLDNEPLAAVLAFHVDHAVLGGDASLVDCICDALTG